MIRPEPERHAQWVLDELRHHVRENFSGRASALVEESRIQILPGGDLRPDLPPGIYLPWSPSNRRASTFMSPGLTVRGRSFAVSPAKFAGHGWREIHPSCAWLSSPSGALTPSWDMIGECTALLTGGWDTEKLDVHGRADEAQSPRVSSGAFRNPTVNLAAFQLVVGAALASGLSQDWVEDHVLPPVLHLSHDLDNLSDRNRWLQAARIRRVLGPEGLRTAQARFLWESIIGTRRHMALDVDGFQDMEADRGFWSRFYLLNGTPGRYGSRDSSKHVRRAALRIRPPNEVGLHYNYDTHLSPERLSRDREALEAETGLRVLSGRAHYLRLSFRESPRVWAESGILLDESIGYAGYCGFRAGLGGAFQPFDSVVGKPTELLCLPLLAMDAAMVRENPEDPSRPVKDLLDLIGTLGGAVTVLFHNGYLANDEFPQYRGVYSEILDYAKQLRVRQISTADLLRMRGLLKE